MEAFIKTFTLAALLLFYRLPAEASQQQPPQDTASKRIEIVRAGNLRQITNDTGVVLNSLAGNAMIRHQNTLLSGDSIVFDPAEGWAEVFGHVHINDGDSVTTDADYLRYIGRERKAFLKKHVKLIDRKGTLVADEIIYDISTGIATYEGNGRVENGTTTLKSKSATYFSDSKDVYFRRSVHLTDPKYDIVADSLRYNTERKLATFIAPTRIKARDGSIIETRSGTYDLLTGEARFLDRTVYRDSIRSMEGDHIAYEEKSGEVQIEGKGRVVDSVNRVLVMGERIVINKKQQTFLACRKSVMVFYDKEDSTFISADTLYSAIKRDTVVATAAVDTTTANPSLPVRDSIRYFLAYHHVKVFNDSLQAVADSLYYSDLDSSFRLYYDPVCWNNESQVSGDTILLFTEKRKPVHLQVLENSLVASRTREGFFNQVGGRMLNGYFKDGKFDHARMKGSPAASVYYAQDKDSAYIGMNYSTGDVVDVFFSDGKLDKVKFINNVDGTMYPMSGIPAGKNILKGFRWQENRRPRSRADLFE